MTSAILVEVAAVGAGRYRASLNGAVLVRASRQPFLDAARVLIAANYDPGTVMVMRHAGSDIDALRAPIGTAATLAVREDEKRGPVRPLQGIPFCRRSPAHRANR
jgi:hypothetical protein